VLTHNHLTRKTISPLTMKQDIMWAPKTLWEKKRLLTWFELTTHINNTKYLFHVLRGSESAELRVCVEAHLHDGHILHETNFGRFQTPFSSLIVCYWGSEYPNLIMRVTPTERRVIRGSPEVEVEVEVWVRSEASHASWDPQKSDLHVLCTHRGLGEASIASAN
jgi:hypothetical protein